MCFIVCEQYNTYYVSDSWTRRHSISLIDRRIIVGKPLLPRYIYDFPKKLLLVHRKETAFVPTCPCTR